MPLTRLAGVPPMIVGNRIADVKGGEKNSGISFWKRSVPEFFLPAVRLWGMIKEKPEGRD